MFLQLAKSRSLTAWRVFLMICPVWSHASAIEKFLWFKIRLKHVWVTAIRVWTVSLLFLVLQRISWFVWGALCRESLLDVVVGHFCVASWNQNLKGWREMGEDAGEPRLQGGMNENWCGWLEKKEGRLGPVMRWPCPGVDGKVGRPPRSLRALPRHKNESIAFCVLLPSSCGGCFPCQTHVPCSALLGKAFCSTVLRLTSALCSSQERWQWDQLLYVNQRSEQASFWGE